MATQLKKVVAPSGGDYTSLEACMNANEQNLVTADKYFDVEIDGDWSGGADTTAVSIHNYTTDATHYINIYTTAAARHAGYYDTTKYRLEVSSVNQAMSITNPVVLKLTGLAVKNTNAASNARALNFTTDLASTVTTDKLIAIGTDGYAYRIWAYGGTHTITNSVFINTETAEGAFTGLCNLNIYNCVIVHQGAGIGLQRQSGTWTAKNCYAATVGSSAYSGTITKTTCASDDNTGSVGLRNIAFDTASGAYFTNITGGSENFHIGASSELKNVGTDLSANFTDDIDGQTRPTGAGTWDIGVDEYVASAGGAGKMTLKTGYWGDL